MKILIAGAGIGGLTAAIALSQQGHQVAVFEQAKKLQEVGAGIQLSPNAMQVMQKLGLEQELEKVAFEPEFATLRHFKTGKTVYSTQLKSLCRERYGAPYFHLHRADLLKILKAKAKQSKTIVALNSRVENYSQTPDLATLYFENGRRLNGDLIIGADGIHSTIRQQMHGQSKPSFTKQIAWRGLIQTSKLPSELVRPGVTVWMGPKRHLVTYYVRGGQLVNFVAVEEKDQWTKESWNTRGVGFQQLSALRSSFSNWHPAVTQILDSATKTFLWGLFDRKPLKKWSDGRVTLLGDACHPMLPFMAQGAAMAIEDAYVLSHLLPETLQADKLRGALKRYEKVRKPRTTYIQNQSNKNASVYHMHDALSGNIKLRITKAVTNLVPKVPQKRLDKIYSWKPDS